MNKLVIIGNGFDLAHGLKTSYSDFLLWYIQKIMSKLEKEFSYKDDVLNIKFFQAKPEFYKISSIKQFSEFISNENSPVGTSQFVRRLINNYGNSNWVDIEFEFYDELIRIYDQYEKGRIQKDHAIILAESINKVMNTLKENLKEYLLTIDSVLDSTNKEIQDNLILEFNDARYNSRLQINDVLFLNFNYTSTIELYLKAFAAHKVDVNYIHGQLNSHENPLVFGYGDEMDIDYSKMERLNSNMFITNFKSFDYFKTNNYQNVLGFIDSEIFNVYILGHSCGISDRVLLNTIFEHEHCNSIKIFYHQISEATNDFYEKTQQISRHFKMDGRGLMRKRIVPYLNCKPLVKYNPLSADLQSVPEKA